MKIKKMEGIIEAILFTMGESVELDKIARTLEQDVETTRKVIHNMIEYDLVAEVGRMDAPGRPLLFGTTEEFLRRFSVQSVDELPSINPEKMEDFKAEAEDEVQLRLNL